MCKVMMMAGITDATRNNAIKFTKVMGELMSVANRDGLGYAAVDAEGELFGERWLHNGMAFNTAIPLSETDQLDNKVITIFNKFFTTSKSLNTPVVLNDTTYSKFGEPDLNKMVAITLHTRTATSAKGIKNTHPFVWNDTTVVHNGIISNYDEFTLETSTCDSEAILISYLRNAVSDNIKNVEGMAKELTGYYACGTFARNELGYRVLDLYKANNQSFHVAFVKELNTYVFASSEYDITQACTRLGFTSSKGFQMKDGIIIRVDPISGNVLDSSEFTESTRFTSSSTGHWDKVNNHWVFNNKKKETKAVTHLPVKKQNISEEMVSYYKTKISFRELNEREVEEFNKNWRS